MSFEVTIAGSGHRFEVDEDETILDAAIRQDIGLPYGCRNGFCGACLATLVEGEVEYPDGEPDKLIDAAEDACLPCQAVPRSDLVLEVEEIETPEEIKPRTMPVKVVKIDHLADDVVRLWLKLPEEQRLQFMAGQYLDFLLDDGRRRAFSIANPPHEDDLIELHIRHVDGGVFTDWAFTQMKDGTILRIEAPLGTFTLDEESDRPMLFIAGGTGFAPIKSQIEHAFHAGLDRPMVLYWGVRSQEDLYLPDLPRQWEKEHENFRFVPVLSEPGEGWQGRSGWVHEAVLEDLGDELPKYDVYMAGPPPMVSAARDALLERGVPESQLHYDSFEYAAD
ncbi:MAG TPA: CDP-6-deoxy-delta-3,4-glucoseen reductase [Thiolapillus brandeum]|uniref:CDP-6-deoxy-delta-3,4-glucoseen reductase n=1 Tax=Thiolapillus brandeum TaxID=1076588 RepID=A0A7C5IZZ9_9GAMM|nr:CDP-6-deoxy-delta-3,4-glucoseen reductase [Thiolapillus brandeum]